MSSDTLYEILNVPPDASTEEIRAAFHRLSVRVHPDQGGSDSLFRSVKDAYDTLSDQRRRAEYDRSLRAPAGARHATKDDAAGWVRVDDQPRGGWGTGPGGNAGPQPHPPPPQAHGGGPRHPNWTPYAGPSASGAPARPGPSFIARHLGATVAVSGAIVTLVLFLVAFAVAGPVVFIAPSLLLVLMGLVALVAVRSAAVTGGRGRPARRRSARRRR